MKNNSLKERQITRNFLNEIAGSPLTLGISFTDSNHAYSSSDIDPDGDGVVNKEDLFNHFDLDNDGSVTTDEYVDHVKYHANNPETLDHYSSNDSVPCHDSYNMCKSHHESDEEMLRNCITASGASCFESGLQALIDVLSAMKNNCSS
jgi:hypothetical protein